MFGHSHGTPLGNNSIKCNPGTGNLIGDMDGQLELCLHDDLMILFKLPSYVFIS